MLFGHTNRCHTNRSLKLPSFRHFRDWFLTPTGRTEKNTQGFVSQGFGFGFGPFAGGTHRTVRISIRITAESHDTIPLSLGGSRSVLHGSLNGGLADEGLAQKALVKQEGLFPAVVTRRGIWSQSAPRRPRLALKNLLNKSWFSERGWGQQLFSFQSPAGHWMAWISSLKCQSLPNPSFTECLPPFHWKALFSPKKILFHWKVLCRIPFPKIGSYPNQPRKDPVFQGGRFARFSLKL